MNIEESVFTFTCEGKSLVGLISAPDRPDTRGVLIVVGGPQYRAGSHRQFTLLSRALAAEGIPTMRFDYRGMGDSEGELRTFEQVQSDIRAAIDAFFERQPNAREIVLWGLCDAASAISFYAHTDPRVSGITLANPWVRTEEGFAKAQLKHYYVMRFLDPGLWQKIRAGDFSIAASVRGLAGSLWRTIKPGAGSSQNGHAGNPKIIIAPGAPLPERMRQGLERFNGKVLLVLSGNDLTAREFEDTVRASSRWRARLKQADVTHRKLQEADHTFSRREWRNKVAAWTGEWVRSW